MHIRRLRRILALFVLPFALHVAAQETPKLEVFGESSYVRLSGQPRTRLKSAGLNGWSASVKLNVTDRVGLVADFGGHYGQQLTLVSLNPANTPIHQYTYVFGPEVRVLNSGRLTVNLRALLGVAHTNPLGPAIARFSPGNNFAASFGGSVDYRLTDRLSYRIVQPELLLTRSGGMATGSFNQSNARDPIRR